MIPHDIQSIYTSLKVGYIQNVIIIPVMCAQLGPFSSVCHVSIKPSTAITVQYVLDKTLIVANYAITDNVGNHQILSIASAARLIANDVISKSNNTLCM